MILIVDDKRENVFSLKTVLEQHAFQADTALSGEEALKKVLRHDYALIILDVQMPDMDGFEVAEALTGLNKTRDIPIIFLSAINTHKKYVTKGLESGAVEYLTKPVDPDILILKVRNFYRLYEKNAELREAEKALKQTVNELYSTLEALPQLAFTANHAGEVEYVNQHWLDYSASNKEFPETRDAATLQETWLSLISKGQPVEKEIAIRKISDGNFYHHLLRATPIKTNGFTRRWVGTFTSIHDQKLTRELLEKKVAERTRELLEANRELEISNNDLQQFTSVTSHDLKEPLRKIQFFGNMLQEKASLSQEHNTLLEKIILSSNRMSNLIDDLLSFASLSSPHLFESTDINQIIADILTDLELTIIEKKADIQVENLPRLEVIPALARQLFQNLISNALKFSKPGIHPQIRISGVRTEVPAVDAPVVAEGSYCRIAISDNGIGFDEVYADKIFTIFQRLNARTEYEGTGIGLAIAKKIVDRHNGLIFARSRQGAGAVFYIILPLVQDPLHKAKEENHFTATQLP